MLLGQLLETEKRLDPVLHRHGAPRAERGLGGGDGLVEQRGVGRLHEAEGASIDGR